MPPEPGQHRPAFEGLAQPLSSMPSNTEPRASSSLSSSPREGHGPLHEGRRGRHPRPRAKREGRNCSRQTHYARASGTGERDGSIRLSAARRAGIGCPERRPRLLPMKHQQLMTQNQQLDVLGELTAAATQEQPQQRREREIRKGKSIRRCSQNPPPPTDRNLALKPSGCGGSV